MSDYIKDILLEEISFKVSICDFDGNTVGSLRPATLSILEDNDMIGKITKWRNNARHYFLTQFNATSERTKKWMESVVLRDYRRLFFIVYTDKGNPVGHMGFKDMSCGATELDNFMRGEIGGHSRLIGFGEYCMLKWIFDVFPIELVRCSCLSNNNIAILLHETLGFKKTESFRLYETKSQDEVLMSREKRQGSVEVPYYLQELILRKSDFKEVASFLNDLTSRKN